MTRAKSSHSGAPYDALCRIPDRFSSATLVITAEPNPSTDWLKLARDSQCTVQSWIKSVLNAYPTDIPQKLALPQPADLTFDQVVLVWPKAKELGRCLLQLLATRYPQITVVGANDAGGKSIAKAAPELIEEATKLDSARRCSIWQLQLSPQAAETFNWLKLAQSFTACGQSFMTLPGVFSHGRIDVGTSVLLEYLPAPAAGRILDLGCGSGVIGLTMKQRNPELNVALADVDVLATRSSELNALRQGHEVEIFQSDGMADIVGQFDYIISNPPFHQGTNTDYAFAEQLFADAKQQLVSGGQLWIVANRHLPYEDWAKQQFEQVEVMTQEQGFKLIVAY